MDLQSRLQMRLFPKVVELMTMWWCQLHSSPQQCKLINDLKTHNSAETNRLIQKDPEFFLLSCSTTCRQTYSYTHHNTIIPWQAVLTISRIYTHLIYTWRKCYQVQWKWPWNWWIPQVSVGVGNKNLPNENKQ